MKWIVPLVVILLTAGCAPAGLYESNPTAVTSGNEISSLNAEEKVWKLDASASRIAFASLKADEFFETHYFSKLSGEIKANGTATITIYLNDVETRIDIRNERMRDLFFETRKFPKATLTATIDVKKFSDLPIGGRRQTEIEGVLSLHGKEANVFANIFVTRIARTRVEVASTEPVIVYVSDFELDAGLESLRKIADLPSITGAVPVTFSFVFDMQ